MTNNIKEINDVQLIINQLLPLIDEAEKKFTSARNWGFLDILGGGFITASTTMNQINYLLRDLQRELKEVVIPTDFSMNTGTFATFADFVFDGVLADVYMQSKIMTSIEQIKELRRRLEILRGKLRDLSNRY